MVYESSFLLLCELADSMNDIPLCAKGHPMEVTSVTNVRAPKPYMCSGVGCPNYNKSMNNAANYYICRYMYVYL